MKRLMRQRLQQQGKINGTVKETMRKYEMKANKATRKGKWESRLSRKRKIRRRRYRRDEEDECDDGNEDECSV